LAAWLDSGAKPNYQKHFSEKKKKKKKKAENVSQK
jgi:hypothetical protein